MWHHSPAHYLGDQGAFIVAAGTYQKARLLNTDAKLNFAQSRLFECAELCGWELQAWAIMSNHYHIIAVSDPASRSLKELIQRLHSETAREINRLDNTPGRKVWFQYWDTHVTFEKSYFARLNYVHYNPVRHGLVAAADAYRWCSAAWFEQKAEPPFVRMIKGFRSDGISIPDDF